MKFRYCFVIITSILIHLFSWYYVTAFCGVYIKSSISWIYGGVLSTLINFLFVQTAKPLIHLILRFLAKKFSKSK